MTDDLRTALLELERHAPDTAAVREAVHRGIRTRAHRKRLANVAGAAATVVTLAAGAVVLSAGLEQEPVPASSQLVEIDVPDLDWPFDEVMDADRTSSKVSITQGGKAIITNRYQDGERDSSVTVRPTKPPLNKQPKERTAITVGDYPATLRVYPGGRGAEIVWRLPSGKWVVVAARSAERTKQVAAALHVQKDSAVTLSSPLRIGLVPRGYQFEYVAWTDPANPDNPRMLICQPGGVDCFLVGPHTQREYFAPTSNGPEPPDSGGCRTPENEHGNPMPFGKRRNIDGAAVRLSSNGCFAAKYFDGGQVMMLRAPHGSRLTSADFARMAASIELAS